MNSTDARNLAMEYIRRLESNDLDGALFPQLRTRHRTVRPFLLVPARPLFHGLEAPLW
jgi:hypothetical protein